MGPIYTNFESNQIVNHIHNSNNMLERGQYLDSVIAVIPDLIFILNAEGIYLDVLANGKEEMLYMSQKDIIGKSVFNFFDKDLAEQFIQLIQQAIKTKSLQHTTYALNFKAFTEYFEARIMPTNIDDDNEPTVVVIVRDITEQKKIDDSNQIINTVFQEATEGIIIEDENRIVVHVNPAILHILNIDEDEILGKNSDFLSKMLAEESKQTIFESIKSEGRWFGEVELKRVDGEKILVWMTIDTIVDKVKEPAHVVIMVTDISELMLSRKKMEYLATHDSLTDLPNRTLMFEHLNHASTIARRTHTNGALLFIDIDNFKQINDNYSHQTGDILLHEFSNRIRRNIRKSDIFGRLSGDEFLLIMENLTNIQDIHKYIEKLQTSMRHSFVINGTTIHITLSIGVAYFPKNGHSADALIHAADKAMYHVKKNGKNGWHAYDGD